MGVWGWTRDQIMAESSLLAPLRAFNFHRMQWFEPALFGLGFALALQAIATHARGGRAFALALIVAQGSWAVTQSNGNAERHDSGLSFRKYYSVELFREIQLSIGRPLDSYRVASFGLTPAIALYNGFHVVDGFVNDYPLDYKRRFRRVIRRELQKSDSLRMHFDGWGSHVDLFPPSPVFQQLVRCQGHGRLIFHLE